MSSLRDRHAILTPLVRRSRRSPKHEQVALLDKIWIQVARRRLVKSPVTMKNTVPTSNYLRLFSFGMEYLGPPIR